MSILVLGGDFESQVRQVAYGLGEVGVFLTHTSADNAKYNYVTGFQDNTVIGNPVFLADGMLATNNTNCVQTSISETEQISIYTIAKLNSHFAFAVGNYASGAPTGCGIWRSNNQLQFIADRSGAIQPAVIAVPTEYALICGSTNGANNRIHNFTNNTYAVREDTGVRNVKSSKLVIGGNAIGGSSGTGTVNVFMTVIIPGVLSTAQENQLIAIMRKYAAKYGVFI